MKKRAFTPLGVMVTDALREKRMTQVELAREIGTSKQYLYLILHGNRTGRKYLDKIEAVCSIDLSRCMESPLEEKEEK